MKRVMTSALAILLAFALVIPSAATLATDSAENAPALEYTLEQFLTQGPGTASQNEALFQDGAESVVVGDYMLQVDAGTGNFRFTNMKTGQKMDSLPTLFVEGIETIIEAQTKQDFLSDLTVEYFFNPLEAMKSVSENAAGGTGTGNGFSGVSSLQTFYSYTHSLLQDQFSVEKIQNGFRIEYGINEITTPILPLVLSEAQWEKYFSRIEDESVRETLEYRYVAYDFGEIRQQRSYWQKLVNSDKKNMDYANELSYWNSEYSKCVTYPGMQGIWNRKDNGIYYICTGTAGEGNFTADDLKYFEEAWTKHAKMTEEEYTDLCQELNGYTNPYANGGCLVPVELTIDAGGVLNYNVMVEEIEAGPGFYVNYIHAARWLCTSLTNEEGYLVVPSGSGAIIDNQASDVVMPQALYQLGGTDNAKSQSAGIPYRENNVLPVFGVVKNGTAITAIVESGVTHTALETEVNYPIAGISINRIGVQFETILYDSIKVDGFSSNEQQGFQLFPRQIVDGLAYGLLPEGTFGISYRMSSGNDANYTYMASVYRDKLIAGGMTEKLDADEDIPLMMDIFGCIDKSVLVLGIPFETKYALTRFDEAKEIMEYLKAEAGVEDFDIRYLGWANGGYFSSSPTKIKVQRQLGGTEGLTALISYAEENGYGLYPDVNLVTVYKDLWFDGYNSNKMTSKRIDFVYAILHGTDLVTGRTMSGWHSRFVISPRYYDTVFTKFRSEIDKKIPELKSYAFSENGKSVSSDFTLNKYVYRNESTQMVAEFMRQFEEDGYKIATETGAEFMLPYVSNIWRLPQSSSKLLIETEQIPLAQMVLHGSVVYCGEAINETQDDELYILRCLEMGMVPYLESMYTVDDDLKDTLFMDYFSLNYKDWTESVKTIYSEVNEVMKDLQDQAIAGHEILASNVRKTTYANGVSVIVNYSKAPYDYNGQTVDARGYVVIK